MGSDRQISHIIAAVLEALPVTATSTESVFKVVVIPESFSVSSPAREFVPVPESRNEFAPVSAPAPESTPVSAPAPEFAHFIKFIPEYTTVQTN